MRVYRIQHKTDRTIGAYTAKYPQPNVIREMYWAHSDDKHPSPIMDNRICRFPKNYEYCGFLSAAELLRWFKGFIPGLLRAGYKIVVLDNVKITAKGKSQVLFKWKDEVKNG